jgi:hypothetical protein
MLSRQPLRYLRADDPGAGKTIMTSLFIKELRARGDLQRCLIVCPGNLAEQWQDERYRRFHLPFAIMTNDALEAARTGNWFAEPPLAICRLGYLPRDVSDQNLGYDIESAVPGTGLLRFIEVKGRVLGAQTVTLTKNEILTGLNKPDHFILAIGLIDGDNVEVRHVRKPFVREPDFGATSVNYDLAALLAQSQEPS